MDRAVRSGQNGCCDARLELFRAPFMLRTFHTSNMRGLSILCFLALFVTPSLLSSGPLAAQTLNKQQAMLLTQQGKFREAKEAWLQLAAQDPKDYIVQANLGLVLAQLGEYKDAIAAYHKSLASHPDEPSVRMNLGLAEFKQGNFAAASSSFSSLASTKTPDPRLETLLGLSYYGQQLYTKAIPHLTIASQNDPSNPELHYVLAESCLHGMKPECSLSESQRLLQLSPDSAEAHMLRWRSTRRHQTGKRSDRQNSLPPQQPIRYSQTSISALAISTGKSMTTIRLLRNSNRKYSTIPGARSPIPILAT